MTGRRQLPHRAAPALTAGEAMDRPRAAARTVGVAGHARLGGGLLAALLAMLAVGCGREDDSSSRRGFLAPANYAADAQRGRQVFQANCAACHGTDARGTDRGPPLIDPVYRPGHHADLAFYFAVRNGVQPHHWRFGPMPPVKGVSPEQVADIIAWVRQRQRSAGIH